MLTMVDILLLAKIDVRVEELTLYPNIIVQIICNVLLPDETWMVE